MYKTPIQTNYDNENFIKYDLHVHSICSYDSLSSLKNIIKIGEKKGLKGLAITDHNTIKGAIKAKKINRKIEIIVGSEIKTDKGDVIGLFLNKEIKSRKFDDVVEEIRNQDGFIILPHPYKTHENIPEDILQKIDAIEVFNGRIMPKLNKKAQDFLIGKKLLSTGGSDAHFVNAVGSVMTIFDSNIEKITGDNIRNALKEAIIIGKESPQYTHYYTSAIGNIRTKQYSKFMKSLSRKLLPFLKK